MTYKRALRYLAPNLITGANIVFGILSLIATHEGRYIDASWWVVYAVLLDRLDGFVARLVRGTSELGVQLDSFADFLNFGVAPAFLIYVSLGDIPAFDDGGGRALLMFSCMAWVLAAVFRLARYNITPDVPSPNAMKIFFGVPTTLAGGLLVLWYLAFLKYVENAPEIGGKQLFAGLETPDTVWRYFPVAMLIGAYLMASSLRMPKVGVVRSKLANAFVFTNLFLCYACGVLRLFPEYMVLPGTAWLILFLIWGQASPAARRMVPPPIFPAADPPPGEEPVRPEDDMLPEDDEDPLDPPHDGGSSKVDVEDPATRRV
jgi:CDP-diacylglycerol--serine O-phosphatidyltransferase